MLGIITGKIRFDMVLPFFKERNWDAILVENSEPSKLDYIPTGAFFITEEEKYVDYVENVAKGFNADFMFSCSSYDNQAILDSMIGARLNKYEIRYIGHPQYCTQLCGNKYRTKQVLEQNGVKTPNYKICYSSKEIKQYVCDFNFPIVIKPLNGWSGHGQRIIKGMDYLTDTCLEQFAFPVIIEEFIDGIEISIEAYKSEDLEIVFPPIFKGATSVEGLHALEKIRVFPYPWEEEIVKQSNEIGKLLAGLLKANGWLDIDGIISNGIIYILEVNSRFSGVCRLIDMSVNINPYEIMLKNQIEKCSLINPIVNGVSMEIPIKADIPDIINEDMYFTRRVRSKNTKGYLTVGGETYSNLIHKLNMFKKLYSVESDIELAIEYIQNTLII